MAPRTYRLYGLALESELALPAPAGDGPALGAVTLGVEADALVDAATARAAGEDWFAYRRLADGADYVRWRGLFEFLVAADGRRIAGRPLGETPPETFHTYLLGQVLSYALLKQGLEPLHATVVLVGGRAVGFLGDCGHGKSTTAAAFLGSGHRLLTDDLLVVSAGAAGPLAHPGPARIKLFPEPARALLGAVAGTPMNGATTKLVIPLEAGPAAPAPLHALYLLPPPTTRARGITLRRLSARHACVELLRNTSNLVVTDADRLARQLALAAWLSTAVPVKRLSFPRTLAALPAVREAVEADLAA